MTNAFELSQEPGKLNIGNFDYCGATQTRFPSEGADVLSFTLNGTQTYGWNGRPNDNDAD